MAKAYLSKLQNLVSELKLAPEVGSSVEIKHFFSGAALYVNDSICATWTPVGLAFKLSESEVAGLISRGEAKPLKYFDKGNVKKGYALFDQPDLIAPDTCRQYFLLAAQGTVSGVK